MAKYRKKPVVVEAEQWFKPGDAGISETMPAKPGQLGVAPVCPHCGAAWDMHGRIQTPEGSMAICPGDWVITGVKGERYPCKPDIFDQTYELIEPDHKSSEESLPERVLNVYNLYNLVKAAREVLFKTSQSTLSELPLNIQAALGILRMLQHELAKYKPIGR